VTVVSVFVAIEGIDHSGKTTLTGSLAALLRPRYRVCTYKEPSVGPIGTLFRQLGVTGTALPIVMALLSAADRHAQQPHLVRQLDDCDVLLADRFYLSGLAYHAADGIDPIFYQRLAVGVRRPDAYLYLDLDPETAAGRAAGRPDSSWEEPEFATRLPAAYRRCLDLVTGTEQAHIVHLDASQPAHLVQRAALAAITSLLTSDTDRRSA
jgi:dTMP kinase